MKGRIWIVLMAGCLLLLSAYGSAGGTSSTSDVPSAGQPQSVPEPL